jgi:hypothetical protein
MVVDLEVTNPVSMRAAGDGRIMNMAHECARDDYNSLPAGFLFVEGFTRRGCGANMET